MKKFIAALLICFLPLNAYAVDPEAKRIQTNTSAFNNNLSGSNTTVQSSLDTLDNMTVFTLPSLTSGSVLFSNGTTIAQDNSGIYYDDSTNRLSTFTTTTNEIVANGSFTGAATSWTVPSGMAYSSNSVSKTSNGTGALTQNVSLYVQREHILTYVISNWTVGTITPSVGGFTCPAVSANTPNPHICRFVATSSSALTFTPSNTARFTIDTISLKRMTGTNTTSNINTGGLSVEGSWSNGSPNTTRAMTFNNDGSYTWTDYRFAGTLRSAFGANSSGGFDMYASGGNYFGFYGGNSGLTSNSLFAYLYPTALVHYGYGAFNSGVMAGATYAPSSTLQSVGGLALQVKRITASQTLDNTATHWLSDGASASACTGTPAVTTCSTYDASGQVTCESHLPCVYNAGTNCNTIGGDSGMTSCLGQSPCTADTTACSGGDMSSCESDDDSYGATTPCAWTLGSNTCPSFTNTTDCNNNSPCYANLGGDCNTLSDGGFDGSMCSGQPECSYDAPTGVCSNTFFTSCDGDNSVYSCTGTKYTGACGGGSFGVSCSGTVLCSAYSSSGACIAETSCLWSSVLNATLPSMLTYPHRTLWVQNDASAGADTVLIASSGETVNGASTYTLSNYLDSVHLAPYNDTRSCGGFVTSGTCTPTGCTPINANCSYDTMSGDCTGNAVCPAHNGNQSNCEGQSYFSYCDGYYVVSKDWHIWSKNDTASGTYTPTLTNTTNISASTSRLATYVRIGNVVTVSGQVDIDPTATGAVLLGLSLPIASNFTTVYQLGGASSSFGIANESYGMEADSTNDRASVKNTAVSTANHTVTYTFTYQLI